MYDLKGKTALVTGASKGIGAGIAKALGASGARVVVNYASDSEGAERTAAAIRQSGGEEATIKADISRAADVHDLFTKMDEIFGPLNILVNNAGVYSFGPVEAVSEQEFHREFDTNVLGALLTMQAAISRFGAEGGTIVNVSSTAITTTPPMTSLYTATKAALAAMSQVLAKELGPRKIRVNVVAPGAVETEGALALGVMGGAWGEQMIAATPLGRFGQPEDIGPAVAFLASDAARWITGEVISVSGGMR